MIHALSCYAKDTTEVIKLKQHGERVYEKERETVPS